MDKLLFMSNAAVAQNIVSLDDYRRARGATGPQRPMPASTSIRQAAPAAPVWVYWVPVWVW